MPAAAANASLTDDSAPLDSVGLRRRVVRARLVSDILVSVMKMVVQTLADGMLNSSAIVLTLHGFHGILNGRLQAQLVT